MIVANHQPQYLPYLGFFHKIARCDAFVVLDDVQFLERGFQNRNLIKMQTGTQWLTVPVLQRYGQMIGEVVIDPTQKWRRKHWAALQTNYNRSPFFKELAPELRSIIEDGSQTHLVSLDVDLLKWAMRLLGIDVPMRLSSELGVTGDKSVKHINICRALSADTYLSGPGGRLYMEMPLFEEAGISVVFQEYSAREYPQQHPKHGFIANLAVVDALFNCGPTEARKLID
jgi:hypothetical protein